MRVVERAYAKVNLFLDVTSCREDGFHNINSVMHSVSLCDDITVMASESDHCNIVISTNIPGLSTGEDNLVYKAVSKYLSRYGITAKIEIHLEKRIPIGAGLGGGSSDAAAALRAMNRIFGRADRDELMVMCAELGSDVPFCLVGGTAVCTGRGEKIVSIPDTSYNFVIAIGSERVSTPDAYRALDNLYNNFASGSYKPNADIPAFYNIFESVTKIEDVRKIKNIMTKNGAEMTLMSGSGPSVFGTFKSREAAEIASEALIAAGFISFAAFSCGGNEL